MIRLFLLLLICCCQLNAKAQQALVEQYHKEQINFTNNSMYVLGGWAIGNIVSGALLQREAVGDNKYMHQGNMYWNIVNLGIAGAALYSNYKVAVPENPRILYNNAMSLERTLLFNTGLDLAYIGAGWGLYNWGNLYSGIKGKRRRGYGKALMIQGAFLLAFDSFLYFNRAGEREKYIRLL